MVECVELVLIVGESWRGVVMVEVPVEVVSRGMGWCVDVVGMATDTALALCAYCQKFQVDCCSFKRSRLLNGTSAARQQLTISATCTREMKS